MDAASLFAQLQGYYNSLFGASQTQKQTTWLTALQTSIAYVVWIAQAFGRGANSETLSAGKTLTVDDAKFQRLDPGGAGRDVTLPAEGMGIGFLIFNAADASESLTVKNDAGATQAVLNQNEAGFFISNPAGTAWVSFGLTGVVDISA